MMRELVISLAFAILAEVLGDFSTKLSDWLVKRAAGRLPRKHRERWHEEWCVVVRTRPRLLRPMFALDLFRAAFFMRRDYLRIAFAKRGMPAALPGVGQLSAKRAFDVLIAAPMLLFLAPLMLTIAVAVRVTSRGAIIFRHRCCAIDGREILLYRFRTMKVCEEVSTRTTEIGQDTRVTRIGSILRLTSLDELPLLLNVLEGKLSVVGLRAWELAGDEAYRKSMKASSTPLKAGIFVWEPEDRKGRPPYEPPQDVQNDLDYIQKWSLWLDFEIIWRALIRVRRQPWV
jgi:lipopolysaccharide/colanic/teichoic acid biosynthesis glycosyltransferase